MNDWVEVSDRFEPESLSRVEMLMAHNRIAHTGSGMDRIHLNFLSIAGYT